MAIGVVATPGILLGLDDEATAPAWAWLGFLSWLGTYVAFPAWAIWLGVADAGARVANRSAVTTRPTGAVPGRTQRPRG